MFQSGYEAIKAQIDKSSSGNSYQRLNGIYWKSGDNKIIRHLHDDPFVAGTHQFVLGRDGKRRGYTCRQSLIAISSSGELSPDPQECPLCKVVISDKNGERPNFPAKRGIGLAVLRETYDGGIRDVLHEVDFSSGQGDARVTEKVTLPMVGVISQSLSNFWNNFMAYYMRYGTTTDRDYEVFRMGSEPKSTSYNVIHCDPVPELSSLRDVSDYYSLALQEKDPRLVLAEWINSMGSESYMKRTLSQDIISSLGWSISEKSKSDSTGNSNPESLDDHPGGLEEFASRSQGSSSGSLDSIRDRLQKYGR